MCFLVYFPMSWSSNQISTSRSFCFGNYEANGDLQSTDLSKFFSFQQAADDRQISLTFTDFSVGVQVGTRCISDRVYVDISGDIDYAAREMVCGSSPSSTTFLSETNLMNVLLVGGSGNFPGFSANYTLV